MERLEQVFASLEVSPKGKKCKAMEGLVEEGAELMKEDADPDVMDAGLIAAAQRVEHYEMAGYGCVRTYAQLLGETKAATLLQKTLDEEGAADKKLTQIAKQINVDAEGDEEEASAGSEQWQEDDQAPTRCSLGISRILYSRDDFRRSTPHLSPRGRHVSSRQEAHVHGKRGHPRSTIWQHAFGAIRWRQRRVGGCDAVFNSGAQLR